MGGGVLVFKVGEASEGADRHPLFYDDCAPVGGCDGGWKEEVGESRGGVTEGTAWLEEGAEEAVTII